MKANIITIGNEILIGQVTDTNSSFIARELNRIGISVYRMISIADDRDEIIKTLENTENEVEIVFMTGGLGPTNDDITKPALADYFDSKMIINTDVLEDVTIFFLKRGVQLSERNRKQADVPEKCDVIPNKSGTAPGMLFEKNGKVFISMPGVPFEMEEMFKEAVIPMLIKKFKLPCIYHYTIVTSGLPESQMADRIQSWENKLPGNIKLAYLPSPGILKLRLSACGDNEEKIKKDVDAEAEKLKEAIEDFIIGYGEDTIETVIGRLLKERNYSLSVTESCTGGYISKMITSVPGSSIYYRGGVIAYSNDIKNKFLGVKNSDLLKYGAVSESVVKQMAEGVIRKFKSSYSIATSGIAGPDGGTPEKPVGTTWIAVSSGRKTVAKVFKFGDNRERNIIRASVTALNMLRMFIRET